MNSLTLRTQIPCGHEIIFVVHDKSALLPNEGVPSFMKYATDAICYWMQVRGTAHQCALVSEANPNGIPPR